MKDDDIVTLDLLLAFASKLELLVEEAKTYAETRVYATLAHEIRAIIENFERRSKDS